MLSNITTCVYLQLETQKLAIFHSMIQYLTKELTKLSHLAALQNKVSPAHFTLCCADCSKFYGYGEAAQADIIAESRNLANVKMKLENLFAEVSSYLTPQRSLSPKETAHDQGLLNFDTNLMNPTDITDISSARGLFESNRLLSMLEKANQLNKNYRESLSRAEEIEKMLTTANLDSEMNMNHHRTVPKIDRNRNLGFKPQADFINPAQKREGRAFLIDEQLFPERAKVS